MIKRIENGTGKKVAEVVFINRKSILWDLHYYQGGIMKGKTVLFLLLSLIMFYLPDYSHALTSEQVLELRKAGVSDKTIQIMLQQENDAKKSRDTGMGQREIRDDQGNSVVVYSTGRSTRSASDEEEKQKVEKAWEMLQHLIIDKRSGRPTTTTTTP
jgi:hypothetical protein